MPLCVKGPGGPEQAHSQTVGRHDVAVARFAAVWMTLRFVEFGDGGVAPTFRPRFLDEGEPIAVIATRILFLVSGLRRAHIVINVTSRSFFRKPIGTRDWSTRQQAIAVIRVVTKPANYIWISAAIT